MSRRHDLGAMATGRPPAAGPRLAFYIHSMHGGGAERVSALVASGFARRGYPVDLVVNEAGGPHMEFVSGDVRVVSLDCRTATALPHLLGYLRETKPACLISALQHNNLNAAIAAGLAGTPFAATVHGIMSVHRWNLRTSGLFGSVAQMAAPLIYRLSDAVGVVSDAVRQDIAYSANRPDKFCVLHNPVDTEHFSPDAREADEAATKLPVEDRSPVVLGVGRFDRAKNFDLLIRAVCAMQAVQPARLVLLGDGPERPRLERLAHKLDLGDRVFMPGFVADPAPWYRRAAVHAVTSECEGFGNTIVESLATGTPVLITRGLGAPAELLGHGQYGAIVNADEAALAESLIETLRHPPDSAPLIARANVFSLESCLDRYEAMVEGMLNPAARRLQVQDATRTT